VRIATLAGAAGPGLAVVEGDRALPAGWPGAPGSMAGLAAAGPEALDALAAWAASRPEGEWLPVASLELGPAVADPGAIYTIGLNYRDPSDPADAGRPPRPLVYGKAASAVAGHGAVLAWDRSVADAVDSEVELGVVIGAEAWDVPVEDAMSHVFGYTVVNDVTSREERLDGDQWLLGKSMPGFAPVGPWVVTRDALDPRDLRLSCELDGELLQDGRTSAMRFGVAEIVSFLSRHARLRAGDLIATGTPPRLATPPGPGRHLAPGDTVTVRIEGIGALTTHVALTRRRAA
jgi:2-keto-4-pentenoate hydratase/2-oxohepta-3-ene-1,7-dioic acid hydratase in catechol pathway